MRSPDPFADYDRLKPGCVAAMRARHASLGAHDADALYQAAWIALWRHAGAVRDTRAFLLAAMRRRWADELRRAHRRHELPLGTELPVADRTPPDVEPLHVALRTLAAAVGDDALRAVFALAWLRGLTRREAATALGLDWGRPLQKRLDRASRRLRIALRAARDAS